MQQKALADVTTWPNEPVQLIGSKCDACGATTFPVQNRCPRCSKSVMSELALPSKGTLTAWTTQGFAPKEPFLAHDDPNFEPFGVGLVRLGDVVQVEARLTTADPDQLELGMPLELVMVPIATDEDGAEVLSFAFAPSK
jgi:uncharacterized OB-fold protein